MCLQIRTIVREGRQTAKAQVRGADPEESLGPTDRGHTSATQLSLIEKAKERATHGCVRAIDVRWSHIAEASLEDGGDVASASCSR